MNANLNTKRMIGEPLSDVHQKEILILHSDPNVAQMLSANGKPISEAETKESILKAKKHWNRHGFGLWAFYRKGCGSFIGRGGIINYVLEDLNDIKVLGLAYAVCSTYWGKGYATEMAKASLIFAFNDLHASSVASWTLPQNIASQRVMEKLGFNYKKEFTFAGLKHRFYTIDANDFKDNL